MGKEGDLLKAVRTNDKGKLQKILVPEKGYQIQRVSHSSPGGIPGGRIRMTVVHVDINCHEEGTGYTPLTQAVLNGNKDMVEMLLFYSANVDIPDAKGNTPLHMAVWVGRQDLMTMLMKDGAKVDVQNSDGNTPLHIVCQTDIENRTLVINSLLRASADVTIRNKNGHMAIDVAAMYNKKDAVSVLLDHSPFLATTTSSLVEASIRGYEKIVHLLLDYGVNPNLIDKDRQTCALHEAARFARLDVAEILLKYGASHEVENGKKETASSLSKLLPGPLKDKFQKLFEEYTKSGPTEVPRFSVTDPSKAPKQDLKDYPELPTDSEWTKNTLEFCNECTADNPNTNLFDGRLDTFWVIPAVSQAWTVLDLKHVHTLTGLTIYGWDSPQMVKRFELQKAEDILGPWNTVKPFHCERKGSSNPADPGEPQTFKDFTDSSRYWRINIMSNHDGKCICFQGLSLFGADNRIIELLGKLNISQYAEAFIKAGYNTLRKLLLMPKTDLENIVIDKTDLLAIESEIVSRRQKEFPLTFLKWVQHPPRLCTEGRVLPDIVVKGDVGCTSEVTLITEGSNSVLAGETVKRLIFDDVKQTSTATFKGLLCQRAGVFQVVVKGHEDENVVLKAPSTLEIKPKNTLTTEMEKSFQDMQDMLQGLQDSLDFPT